MISINNIVLNEEFTREPDHERASSECAPQVYDCFVGVSRHVAELKEFVSASASSPHPILLIGERGLRQEQAARALHEASPAASQPFVTINTYTLSEDHLYHLLFGSSNVFKGIEQGTVFINGLVTLPSIIQQKLAALLEDMKWQLNRVEGKLPRLMISTEWNQAQINAENRIGYSLVELLRPHSFAIKPLRERSEDIAPLAAHLLDHLVNRLQMGKCELTPETIKALSAYSWERNIDELEAVLEGALANTRPQQIDVPLLPTHIRQANFSSFPEGGVDLPQIIDDFERSLIEMALRQMGGNQARAARLLGLRAQTLNMKLKRLRMHTFQAGSSDTVAQY